VIDECHHLSAVSFEVVARRNNARCILGLSATVTRKALVRPTQILQLNQQDSFRGERHFARRAASR
jgi:superfamily II DNA or RNA helicase